MKATSILPLFFLLLLLLHHAHSTRQRSKYSQNNSVQTNHLPHSYQPKYKKKTLECQLQCGQQKEDRCVKKCVSLKCFEQHLEQYEVKKRPFLSSAKSDLKLEAGEVDTRVDKFKECAQKELEGTRPQKSGVGGWMVPSVWMTVLLSFLLLDPTVQ